MEYNGVDTSPSSDTADRNWRRFVLFRVLFNSRFYYPVLAVMFLDLGLTATQYTLLNFAWAIAIVCTDLPAGALADRVGRRPLVVAAAVAMVIEMTVLCVAPVGGGTLLFLLCLANRLLSGIAEGLASGADEALVFDSLAESGRSTEWPQVLDQVTRCQSVGLVVAMLIGGAIYDPGFMNSIANAFRFPGGFTQGTTLRFPVFLNLITAALTLVVALSMREPGRKSTRNTPVADDRPQPPKETAIEAVLTAGGWIARSPLALFVILAGLLLDSVIRLFLTFSSSYFRLIDLPAASYGLIWAGLGALGFLVSPVARRMVQRGSPAGNFAWLAVVTLTALAGLALRWTWSGVVFTFTLGASMVAIGFFLSYYLNALVESNRRATVLSFKSVAFNLGYGLVSLLFAFLLRALRHGGSAEETFGRTLIWLPVGLGLGLALLTVLFRKYTPLLNQPVGVARDAAENSP
jgi:MFS family permease